MNETRLNTVAQLRALLIASLGEPTCIKLRVAGYAGNATVMYACAQIAGGFGHMLRRCWQSVRREETMKHNAFRGQKSPKLPIAWREAEYAALRTDAADTCDDRVSEDIFDVEDERAEVDIIVHGMIHDAN